MVLDTKTSLFKRSTVLTVLYLVHYDTFLQNETDVITKCDKVLLQNGSDFLFQNATVLI